jgi:hypothetical protein
MKFIVKPMLFVCFVAVSFGATWTGSLIDSNCHDRQKQDKNATVCTVTQSTSAFALQTNTGKIYKLDAAGNAKASTEIQKDAKKANRVTVMGTESGDLIRVDAINFEPQTAKE